MADAARPGALIFRRRLLPWSETFIANQGRALDRYHPVFVGFNLVEAGEEYLAGADRVVLEEHALLGPLGKLRVKALGTLPGRWARALAERNPAVVHAHFGSNAPGAHAVSSHFGVPLLVTFHGADIAVRGDEKRAERRRRVFAMADRVVAVSEFIAGKVAEAGCPPEKIRVHRIGVDTGRFRPGPFEARDDATILFVGRLVEKKGLPHLLRAMRSVRERIPGAEVHVVGDGPLREELEAAARALDAPVRFLGVKTPEEVMALMRTASLLCAPSIVAENGDAEGLPMTIVEAQASGMPVVVFPSGGSAEGVAHGETGFVAPARDEEALADHLATLLEDRELRREMRDAARRRAEAEFDLHRQAERLEALYDEARGVG